MPAMKRIARAQKSTVAKKRETASVGSLACVDLTVAGFEKTASVAGFDRWWPVLKTGVACFRNFARSTRLALRRRATEV
jgi:hypothetical protein